MIQQDRKSGMQGFECNVDAFDKNTLHFWEIYESFPCMNDFRASPEHTKFVMDVRSSFYFAYIRSRCIIL